MSASINIAIVSPTKEVFSETFIKLHKEKLPGNIHYLYGGYLPHASEQGGILVKPTSMLWQLVKKVLIKLRLMSYSDPLRLGIKKYLLDNKIDVVLAEYGPTGAEMLPICQEIDVPVVTHFHGYDASEKKTVNEYKEKYKYMFANAYKVIAVSKYMQKELIAMGAPSEKVVFNPYGANEMFATIEPDYQKANTFLAVGRFVDKKAPYLLLAAFKEVYAKYKEARLVMAGDGILAPTCKNLASLWGIESAVDFPGAISHKAVKELMEKSLCFVQHSITAENGDMEGTPVGIIEAQTAGLPVVSTYHAGIPDVVKDGITGYLVQEKDVKGMAEKMLKIFAERDHAEELGQNAKKLVVKGYSVEKHLRNLTNILEEAAHEKTRS